MKNITTKQFQVLADINLVWDFMTEIYKPYFANGVAAFVFTESSVTSIFFNGSAKKVGQMLQNMDVIMFILPNTFQLIRQAPRTIIVLRECTLY